MEATLLQQAVRAPEEKAYRDVMEEMSADAFAAFRKLVYETPGFVTFFRTATPITEIADLHVGSRPASRKKSDRIEDLRAIPWVFSWSLARIMLPGWYGFGCAVESLVKRRGDGGMATAARNVPRVAFLPGACCPTWTWCWPRADIHIASRYAGTRGGRGPAGAGVFAHRAGMQRSGHALLEITGQRELLEGNPMLARSFRNRSPYVDPLNHLQVEALRRFRCGDTDERTKRADPADHQRSGGRPAQQRIGRSSR